MLRARAVPLLVRLRLMPLRDLLHELGNRGIVQHGSGTSK